MSYASVKVTGANELVRAFRKVDKQLGKAITDELRQVARQVAETAKGVAVFEGFAPPGTSGRGTGALISGIKPSVRAGTAYIKDSANRAGFPYPRIYEFGGRSFLEPALDLEKEFIYDSLEKMLDKLARRESLI